MANLGAVYGVNTPPRDPEQLGAWAYQELNRIANVSREPKESLKLVPIHAEPHKMDNGDIVYADGTNWNPGSGAGFYGRESGIWIKL